MSFQRRAAVLAVLGGVAAFAACADSIGTPSIEDDLNASTTTRTDAARRDSSAADGSDTPLDAELPDAGKKDTGTVKDSATLDSNTPDVTVVSDAAPVVDAGVLEAGPPSTTLVINEVDYDQPAPEGGAADDVGEFVEILNKSSSPVALTGYEVRFYNGSNATTVQTPYLTVPLSGTIAVGQYLVIRATGLPVDGAAMTIDFAAAKNNIQNGGNDSITIVNGATIVDTLTYGTAAGPPPNPALVEGSVPTATDSNTVVGSLVRSPDGTDTNSGNTDWKFSLNPTPGAANTL